MKRKMDLSSGLVLVAWVLMAAGGPCPALADEPSAVEDVILLLKERGVIEEEDAAQMVERNRAYENKKSWMDRLTFFGDFRARFDGEWFERDPLGNKHPERNRLRYRFRVGAKAEINDYFDLTFRLTSSCENRSGNQTLGRGLDCQEGGEKFGFDWDPDGIFINQAFVTYHPFGGRDIPLGGRKLDLLFGKMPNFFHSKKGKDYLVWDTDFSPEGIAVSYGADPLEGLGLTLNAAFFVIDENSSAADPYVSPVQLQLEAHPADRFAVGTNLSYYGYGALDEAFYTRNAGRGNLTDAAGNFGLSSDRRVNIGDLRAWFEYAGIEGWPILVYGNVVNNFSAQSLASSNVGKESLGWGAGLEIGDQKKFVKLGAGYFWIQANAGPSRYIDSDLFDGRTNQKGWVLYGGKRVLSSTDLKFTLFFGEPLEDDITVDGKLYEAALEDSDRIRLQTDVIVKF
jgi:hypothetical protein